MLLASGLGSGFLVQHGSHRLVPEVEEVSIIPGATWEREEKEIRVRFLVLKD